MGTQMPFEVDDRFLRQVYILSLILAIVGTVALSIYRLPIGMSFAIGSFVSLSLIWSLEFVVRRVIRPAQSPKAKQMLLFIAFGKYTILFVGFYFLIKADWLNVYAFVVGIGLVQAVIVIKAVGMMISILFYKDSLSNKK
jgi:hypothetical protein